MLSLLGLDPFPRAEAIPKRAPRNNLAMEDQAIFQSGTSIMETLAAPANPNTYVRPACIMAFPEAQFELFSVFI